MSVPDRAGLAGDGVLEHEQNAAPNKVLYIRKDGAPARPRARPSGNGGSKLTNTCIMLKKNVGDLCVLYFMIHFK